MPSTRAQASACGLPAVHSPKLAKRGTLRVMIEKAVERLIDVLDAIDGDPEAEQILGAPEIDARCAATTVPGFGWRLIRMDQEGWAKGAKDDREFVDEDGTRPRPSSPSDAWAPAPSRPL